MAPLLAAAALLGCPATAVHYTATPYGTPWVATRAVTGHLFAYGGRTLMGARVNASDGLVLYTHGRTPDGATKILWVVRNAGPVLRLNATRLDAAGSFSQRFVARGRGQFPSIVEVPSVGCWRITLRSGRARANFVLEAVDLPSKAICEPSQVLRHTPHPQFGAVTWLPAEPRSSGIAAVLFVSTVPGAERALIYAGGEAPEGWSTKFLWWSPHPGATLELSGRRLDGTGTFKQTFGGASSDDPPVTGVFFPSIVSIPAPGCWGVRISTGGRAGLVVFEAV